MAVLIITVQFTMSCLALGMGLFLASEAIRAMPGMRMASRAGARALEAAGGAALLAAGAFGALLSVPL